MLNTANLTRDEIQKLALDFLKGKSRDHRGRNVQDYLEFTEQEMECDHEWIQWAFPIDTESPHNPWAGRLFGGCSAHYKCTGIAYSYQVKLASKYLKSIGFDGLENYGTRSMKCDTGKFFDVVNSPDSHHMKRISRLLRHLYLTGQEYAGKNILRTITRECIARNPDGFKAWTVAYWNAIVYGYTEVFQ